MPRKARPLSGVGLEEEGMQVISPRLPAKDRPGPGDPHYVDEEGKLVGSHVLRSSVQISAEKLAEMEALADEWEKPGGDVKLLSFVQRSALISIQIATELMKANYISPSANQQRLAAATLVVKEGKEIVSMVRKIRGLVDGPR